MQNSNYIKVFTGNFIMAQRIVSNLEKENINAVVKDEEKSARLSGFGTSILGQQDLFVHKDELEKTKLVIKCLSEELETYK